MEQNQYPVEEPQDLDFLHMECAPEQEADDPDPADWENEGGAVA